MTLVYSKHEMMELKVSRGVNKAGAEHWPWTSGKQILDWSGSCWVSPYGKQVRGEELLRKAGNSLRTDYIWEQEWSIPILRKTNRPVSKLVWLSWELVVEQHEGRGSRLWRRTFETFPSHTEVLSTKLMLCWRWCSQRRERATRRATNFSRKRPGRWGCGWTACLI